MGTPVEIRPQPGPQEAFLSSPADICIYGGAAGGGKTWGLLIEPLRHIDNPDFGAVLFRRTYAEVRNEGGLWDEAMKIYPLFGAKPRIGELSFSFPSAATVSFGHLQFEQDKFRWQGSQVPLLGFDELTHFSRSQFFYMMSRNRSMSGIRSYIRATTNPDSESWVSEFLEWWIDPDTGFAIKERAGVLRWFVQSGEETLWANSPDDLKSETIGAVPKSVTFIPASVQDNKKLLEKDPGYLSNLASLPYVERMRLLDGNWRVRPGAGKVFNREWFEIVDFAPMEGVDARFWDFAATVVKVRGDDPDYTATVRIRRSGGFYYIVHASQVRKSPPELEAYMRQVVAHDQVELKGSKVQYLLRWEIEPGSAGIRETHRLTQFFPGLDRQGVHPYGDKLTRAKPFASQAEMGLVKVLRAPWTEMLLSHLHHQPDLPHDDLMDACSGAFATLEGQIRRRARSVRG